MRQGPLRLTSVGRPWFWGSSTWGASVSTSRRMAPTCGASMKSLVTCRSTPSPRIAWAIAWSLYGLSFSWSARDCAGSSPYFREVSMSSKKEPAPPGAPKWGASRCRAPIGKQALRLRSAAISKPDRPQQSLLCSLPPGTLPSSAALLASSAATTRPTLCSWEPRRATRCSAVIPPSSGRSGSALCLRSHSTASACWALAASWRGVAWSRAPALALALTLALASTSSFRAPTLPQPAARWTAWASQASSRRPAYLKGLDTQASSCSGAAPRPSRRAWSRTYPAGPASRDSCTAKCRGFHSRTSCDLYRMARPCRAGSKNRSGLACMTDHRTAG
mmetsp:Transcript_38459/g.108768  ORF Transcript_38459/g.108768 Transcript_38459/m.108768 type:complete len:333 (-) Transcript_38459:689-1687(-)